MKYTLLYLLIHSGLVLSDSCEELYQQHLQTDLSLSYEAFDQSMGEGFRALLIDGVNCHKEAAQLIIKYIDANQATQNSLRWHVSQLLATAGDYAQAIKWSKTVLLEQEDFSKRELRWNDYVLGTIAFLEQDKAQLMHHRDVVTAAKDKHFGNELNRKYLDSLVVNFDQSYRYASEHIK